MAANRWKNLDYERPTGGCDERAGPSERIETALEESGLPVLGPHTPRPSDPWRGPVAGVVAQARGAYLIRNYPVAVELLEPRLREEPDLAGGQRILGLALARLQREWEAVERLHEAVRQSGEDWLARASLAGLLLRSDPVDPTDGRSDFAPPPAASLPPRADPPSLTRAMEATTLLREARSIAPLPAVSELLGAAQWRAGQAALQENRFDVSARLFGAAAADFTAAARETGAARTALPVRQSTSFVGEAVALLCAGETETAQRLFSSPARGLKVTEPLCRFAARLFEFCDELSRLPPEDRCEAAGALRGVVLAIRLEVGFYDGRQAVSVAWLGGPS